MGVLDELIEKANKDSKKNLPKEDQQRYRTELLSLFRQNGLSEENISYFASGTKYGSVNCFLIWNRENEQELQIKNLQFLLANEKINSQDNASKLRIRLSLLVAELNAKTINDEIVGELLNSLVEYSFKKDGTRLSDLGKIFKGYFMNDIKQGTVLPDIRKYNFPDDYYKQIILFFNESIRLSDPKGEEEIVKRNVLREWIQKEMNGASLSEENVIVKDSETEQVKKTEANLNINSNEMSLLGKKLIEIANAVNLTEIKNKQIQEELKLKERDLSRAKTNIDKLEALYKSGLIENEKLKQEVNDLKSELSAIQSERKELEDRVDRQTSVLDVYDQDKANTKTELLNQIGSSLKKIYDDYKIAESMTMTIDLGENMRDSLEDVFKKLSKLGVDIEGR